MSGRSYRTRKGRKKSTEKEKGRRKIITEMTGMKYLKEKRIIKRTMRSNRPAEAYPNLILRGLQLCLPVGPDS